MIKATRVFFFANSVYCKLLGNEFMKTPSLLYRTIHLDDTRYNRGRLRSRRSFYGSSRRTKEVCGVIHTVFIEEWSVNRIRENKKAQDEADYNRGLAGRS